MHVTRCKVQPEVHSAMGRIVENLEIRMVVPLLYWKGFDILNIFLVLVNRHKVYFKLIHHHHHFQLAGC